jgi:signal transduction histidine kinase
MKKIVIFTILLWITSLIISTVLLYPNNTFEEDYRININRIQNKLENNPNDIQQIIEELTRQELGSVQDIQIIARENAAGSELQSFFNNYQRSEYRDIYHLTADGSHLVKYRIESGEENEFSQVIIVSILITFIFLIFLIIIIYIYNNILKPVEVMAEVPEKLAAGYLESLDFSYKNKNISRFIWGLDMLRVKLEEEKARNKELEKDRKTLVAGLSHDIRTPLSSIKNYAIALKENIYQTPEAKNRALEVIVDKTDVIEKLTKDLLESANKEIAATNIEVNPEEIYLEEIEERIDQIITEKIELLHMEYQKRRPEKNIILKADLDALSQVFNNIIENAVKYGDLKTIRVDYQIEDYYQLISIENSGSFIPKQEIKHIFSSYYRGSNVKKEKGFGLGLYVSKRIMEAMEGDIYAVNTDQGVKVVVVIKMAV